METQRYIVEEKNMPATWRYFLSLIAICKASIAGGGLALATLGAMDIALAASAHEWWNSMNIDSYINGFAMTGGIIGAVSQAFYIFINR